MFGFLNIDKPKGMTSHDVVARLRRISKIKQIGHTGTLDPMATGVLPVAIGKCSRLIEFLNEEKEYVADLEFGKISDTYDIEGNIKHFSDKKVQEEDVIKNLEYFKGMIEQTPPVYSAIHYKGKRLYELAREGIVPNDIPKRKVFINKIELLNFDANLQTARLKIQCSKGTYIRSIINDLGKYLETGAVMTELKRTASGIFNIQNTVSLELLTDKEDIQKYLINPLDVLSYNKYELTEFEYQKIIHGQSLNVCDFEDEEYICLTYKNSLCAISYKERNSDKLVTKKVFIS